MRQREHLIAGHLERRRSEQALTDPDKRNQQREPQRINQDVHELNGNEIKPKGEGGDQAKQGSRSQDRKNTEHDSKRQAERDLFRSDPLGEQVQDGAYQPLLQELLHGRWLIVAGR